MTISIITINYNNFQGLEKTIRSVLTQKKKNFEYIVIDGNSSDGSPELLHKYRDFIDKGICEPDNGIYEAMNKGVRLATGDYCLFLNSGDVLATDEVIGNIYKEKLDADIITGDTILYPGGRLWESPEKVSLKTFLKGSLSHQSTLIRRELLIAFPYDESKRIISDWKFCIETLIVNNCTYMRYHNIISEYDTTGISSTFENFKKAEVEKRKALEELLPPRIIADYDALIMGETPFEKLVFRISRNKRYENFLYRILYPLTCIYCRLFNKSLLDDM